eukprot:11112026-Alexandrium_andersonii.AAC.1
MLLAGGALVPTLGEVLRHVVLERAFDVQEPLRTCLFAHQVLGVPHEGPDAVVHRCEPVVSLLLR